MTDKTKKRRRELAAKLDVSHRTAANIIRARVAERFETPVDPIADLIVEMRAVHVSSILVGRLPNVAAGSNLAVVREQLRRRELNPGWFARSASREKLISLPEHDALVERGATEDYGGIQRIRVFKTERDTSFSVPCANCERWIWCGHADHSGKCECDASYEITFDGPIDWRLPQGQLCMNCGERFAMTLAANSRSPWTTINSHQQACNVCFHMQHVGAWWVDKRRNEKR